MNRNEHISLIQQIDQAVAKLDLQQAQLLFSSVKLRSLPAEFRVKYAALARRMGSSKAALRILFPNISNALNSSPQDLIEYATNLRRLGMLKKSRQYLANCGDLPESHLHTAFCWMHEWDYESAERSLEKFLGSSGLSQNQVWLGQVNLAGAKIYTAQGEQAIALLENIKPQLRDSYPHLYINALEIESRVYLAEGQPTKAQDRIDQAAKLISGYDHSTALLVEKWKTVIDCSTGRISIEDERVLDFRRKSRKAGNWESLRDFDWELAKLHSSSGMANSIYFGTPFPFFKSMIKNHSLGALVPTHLTLYDPRSREQHEPSIINALTAEGTKLPFGLLQHRLLLCLLSDRYHPWSVHRIFDHLMSEEFDPFVSPKRVYQLVDRLRSELARDDIKLEMNSSHWGYRLRPLGPQQVHVFERMIFESTEDLAQFLLTKAFQMNSFSLEQAGILFRLKRSQTRRLLQPLIDQGVLKVKLAGKRHLYNV